MNKNQFELLRLISENETFELKHFSDTLYKSLDATEELYYDLIKFGYLDNNNRITDSGVNLLKQHQINNAIILAAGMSTRFVPLNFEIPKGLLSVKGEILIERQIKQLREKGINEIVIVVGYKKEMFYYLRDAYGIKLVETDDYMSRNNHASLYAARDYLRNTIVTSSDLYFTDNIFQKYAFDSYYCTVYVQGKTAERGITTDIDDKIVDTFYGDKCYDTWVTLGYAYFSNSFSQKFLNILDSEFHLSKTKDKYWADIQDDHLDELYMYAKRVDSNIIYEFDTLDELRAFDSNYIYNSGSKILRTLSKKFETTENQLTDIELLKTIKPTLFKFVFKGEVFLCDIECSDLTKSIDYLGDKYVLSRISDETLCVYEKERDYKSTKKPSVNIKNELVKAYSLSEQFKDYHNKSLPLCAAENVVSPFVNLPLTFGFQERYIMNNTYSFNMDDNFIGCEKLFPFYQMISDSCERIFGAKYVDPRPYTGMNTLDMVVKTICKSGDKMLILDKQWGGHASVRPVVERLGIKVFNAPYDFENYDLDYEATNTIIEDEGIDYVLLAPSDIIKPLNVEQINTTNCVLLYDCSQILGLIAAGKCPNPLSTMNNIVLFGGTHKTFPGPASGLIMTNDEYLHNLMENSINPKYLRNSQMHQKISLLFALLEFEEYGSKYMNQVIHCSEYLGKKLCDLGFDVANCNGKISTTHQIFIHCKKEQMDSIYENAYKCRVSLNKKQKELFHGYGIRLGTQEIARYNWNDDALNKIAIILKELDNKDINVKNVQEMICSLPSKKLCFTFSEDIYRKFYELMG